MSVLHSRWLCSITKSVHYTLLPKTLFCYCFADNAMYTPSAGNGDARGWVENRLHAWLSNRAFPALFAPDLFLCDHLTAEIFSLSAGLSGRGACVAVF